MKALSAAGWILALVALAAAAWSYLDRQRLLGVLETLNTEVTALTNQAQAQLAAADALRSQLQALEEQMDATPPPSSAPPSPAPAQAPARPAEATQMEEVEGEGEGEGEEEVAELSEQQQRMVAAQVDAISDMVYGDFLGALNLAPETRSAVEAAIQKAMGEGMMLSQQALRQDPPWTGKEVGARTEAIRQALKETLSNYLDPEQLAAWEQQELVADQILYEQMVAGQLTMLSPGLAEEPRQLMQAVIGEELAIQLEGLETSDAPYTMQRFFDAQLTALSDSAERLRETLTPEEFAHLERYIQQAEQTFEAVAPGS